MRQLAAIGLTVLLAACGGGDSAAPSAPPPTVAAEGFWERTAPGDPVALVILGTGATLGVHTTSGGSIVGALYGKTTASGTTLSGSGKYINIPVPSVKSVEYSGTFVAKSNINVATFTGSPSSPFLGSYTRKADDQPASPTVVEGTFVGVGASGSSLLPTPSLTISSGAITVPSFPFCSVSGTARPHPGGNNIFNVTMKFAGVLCLLGKGDFSGIAFYDATTRQVVVMALNADQSDSFIFVGGKIP